MIVKANDILDEVKRMQFEMDLLRDRDTMVFCSNGNHDDNSLKVLSEFVELLNYISARHEEIASHIEQPWIFGRFNTK